MLFRSLVLAAAGLRTESLESVAASPFVQLGQLLPWPLALETAYLSLEASQLVVVAVGFVPSLEASQLVVAAMDRVVAEFGVAVVLVVAAASGDAAVLLPKMLALAPLLLAESSLLAEALLSAGISPAVLHQKRLLLHKLLLKPQHLQEPLPPHPQSLHEPHNVVRCLLGDSRQGLATHVAE